MNLATPTVTPDTTLVGLLRRIADAETRAELAFMAVNETRGLVPYRQAALWTADRGVAALSGVVNPEENAPYTHYLKRVFAKLGADIAASEPRVLNSEQIGTDLAAEWQEWLPAQALLVPLPAGPSWRGGLLLLAREEPWSPRELPALQTLAAQLALAHRAQPQPLWRRLAGSLNRDNGSAAGSRKRRLLRLALPVVLLATAVIPVRLTVLAPAELVAANPTVVRSPLDGVVEQVLVSPNQLVRVGDPLFEFDRAALETQLAVAERTLDTLSAEYRQQAQQALASEESRAALAVIAGRMAEQSAQVDYLRELASRGRVTAAQDGIAIFDDPAEWAGKPVVTGERVMLVADPTDVAVEAWLSPDDLIELAPGAEVTLYPNPDPLASVTAELVFIAVEASQRPDGNFAYRARARLAPGNADLRVGLKGTAKLGGERVSLWYWLLRKPLSALRRTLGL